MQLSKSIQAVLLMVMLTGSVVKGEFTVSKSEAFGVAQVDRMELVFDKVQLGKPGDYGKIPMDAENFTLEIGGCNITLRGYNDISGIAYAVDSAKGLISDLTEINATDKNIEFSNGATTAKANCTANFEPTDDGKFKTEVKLSGKGVPPNLVLTASKASKYEEEPTVEPTLDSVSSPSTVSASNGLGIWEIVGIAAGVAVLALIVVGGLVCVVCFIRRCKKQSSSQSRSRTSEEGKAANAVNAVNAKPSQDVMEPSKTPEKPGSGEKAEKLGSTEKAGSNEKPGSGEKAVQPSVISKQKAAPSKDKSPVKSTKPEQTGVEGNQRTRHAEVYFKLSEFMDNDKGEATCEEGLDSTFKAIREKAQKASEIFRSD